jgi:D-3-phosphoglycerate dehydrogenase / 2-oxoglutarate reductase
MGSSSKPRLLVVESQGFSEAAATWLNGCCRLTLSDLDRPGLLSAVREAEILWVRLRNRIDADVMKAGPGLRMIVTPTTGLNHIDLKEAERRGIQVLSLRGNTEFLRDVLATAEHTLLLILALLRHLKPACDHAERGGWNRDLFKGREIFGSNIGIVGYGRLGRIVAGYLLALGANVVTSDPYVDQSQIHPQVRNIPLDALLASVDLVTLHVNYSEETRGFFGRAQFAAMKQGSLFVNTSRGELVDERTLLESLQSGRLGGAALDVLCEEFSTGMERHPLLEYARGHDNLIVTPHIGGCTIESIQKTENYLAEKLSVILAACADRGLGAAI